jgi:hypothetical protein
MSNMYGYGTGPNGTSGRNGIAQAILANKYPPPQTFAPQQQQLAGAPGAPPPQATPGAQALGQSPMGAGPQQPGLVPPPNPMAMATGQPPQPMPGLGVPLQQPQLPGGGGGY